MLLQVSVYKRQYVSAFSSLGYIPWSGIVESYGNPMFKFFDNCHCFQQHLYCLHSHQQCIKVPISSHGRQHLLFLFYISHPDGWKCHLIVVLIFISLTISVILSIFHVLIGHLSIFFGELSIQILCSFSKWAVVFCSVVVVLYVINSSGDLQAFFPIAILSLNASFKFWWSPIYLFSFLDWFLVSSKKSLPNPISWMFPIFF